MDKKTKKCVVWHDIVGIVVMGAGFCCVRFFVDAPGPSFRLFSPRQFLLTNNADRGGLRTASSVYRVPLVGGSYNVTLRIICSMNEMIIWRCIVPGRLFFMLVSNGGRVSQGYYRIQASVALF